MHFFCSNNTFCSGRGPFIGLSAAGQAGGPRVPHGASLGLGRVPSRVLRAFKVVKSGN